MYGASTYRSGFASLEDRLRNSRFNPLGMKTAKVADGMVEVKFSASDEEAQAVSEGTRVTDWMFWKMNMKCLLSQAFVNKIMEYRTRRAVVLMEEDVERLRKEADRLESELSDAETRLSFVEQDAAVFLASDRKHQKENTAKESRLRRGMNKLVAEKNMLTRRLRKVEHEERQCRVVLETLRGPIETHASNIREFLGDISGMKSSKERDTAKIRDFFANMFDNAVMKETDSFLPDSQVDYYYHEGDVGASAMESQPYNQFKNNYMTQELEDARATEESEEEEEEEIVLRGAPVPSA